MNSSLSPAFAAPPPEPKLRGHEVHVWTVRTGAPDEIVKRFDELQTPDETARAERFRFDDLRRRFTVVRGALRTILGLYLKQSPAKLRFTYGAHGKPAIDPPSELSFNTSHSGELAIFAVTLGCELGVDLERLRSFKNMQEVANRFFSTAEASELAALAPEERKNAFFLCWTRKEAYIKATGEGLSAALDGFRVTLKPTQPARFVNIRGSVQAAREWTLHNLSLTPDYAAALAYQEAERPLTVFRLLDPADLLHLYGRFL